jgi:chemotaxis protein methyltransferase CheR
LLEKRAATKLMSQKARIWCATVATGQEAYSVAMAVADFVASRPRVGLAIDDFAILATDISSSSLALAREAHYSAWQLRRGISAEQRARYFRHEKGGWVVAESLRRLIEFRRLNLVQPLPHLGTFDLILCRNFLIYLDDDARRRLCQGLHRALNPGGILMIGAAESLYGVSDAFSSEEVGNTLVHRKK